ncbi:Structural maintenance of chromosomes protein 6, partial [Ceratocystis fimbriata CBS 114723]
MPSHKRSYQPHDDSQNSANAGTLASASESPSSPSHRKRPRVHESERPTSQPDSSRNEDNAPDDNLTGEHGNTPPRTQYEIMRDADWQHLQHEELDDRMATQKVLGRTVQIGSNNAAESGIIESVTCINFMCHERLHVELGPLINFVVGENGSGKSAVLTAITLCLGAKASSTNRGGSLKAFIKEGKDSSLIQVKLKNRGEGAYQPEIYGNAIVVERHFNKTGVSGFKIKNGMGSRTISTTRQTIDDIVEHFCLQVDNPLNILSQDNARQFLNSASGALKYKYFVQGVQLESLDRDYRLIEESLENTDAKLNSHDGHLERLKSNADQAHRLANIVRGNNQMRETLQVIRQKLIWAQVIKMEEATAEENQNLQVQETRVRQLEQQRQASLANIDAIMSRILKFKEDCDQATHEYDVFCEQHAEIEAEFTKVKQTVQSLHQEERMAQSQWQAAREEIRQTMEKIKEEEARLNAATGDARARKQEELDNAKVSLQENMNACNDLRASQPDLYQTLETAKADLNEAESEARSKISQISEVDEEIKRLHRAKGNFLDAFPPNMGRLLSLIEKENSWSSKPVGPVGRFVALKRPEWSSIIEKFLGQTPQAFLVKTKSDMDRLRHLMNTAGVKNCPIIKTFGQTLDLTGKEPDPRYNTILRVLDFDNTMVRDALIINHSIEQVILIKDRTEAESVVFEKKPKNSVGCLCFHDHASKRGSGLLLSSRDGSNFSTSPIDRFNGSPRLRSDSEDQIKHRQEHKQHLSADYEQIQQRVNAARAECQKHSSSIMKIDSEVKTLESNQRRVRNLITDLETELDSFESGDNHLRMLRATLKDYQESEQHHGTQYGALVDRKSKESGIMQQSAGRVKLGRQQKAELEKKIEKAKTKVSTNEDALRVAQTDKINIQETLERANTELDQIREQVVKKNSIALKLEQDALAVTSGRIEMDAGENHENLTAKFKSLQHQLRELESRLGGTPEEIVEREQIAMQKYNEGKNLFQELLLTQKALRRALTERIERWRYFQRHLSARTRVNFSYLLSERGFRGKMIIDHRSKILILQVEPDEHRKNGKGRSTNTLSGGEKSFSSICMLLSIWEAMGSSIRCLDEFDVFMDNVNRAISTNMLITAARRSVSRQYILITPNAIEGRAELDKDVKVIRLTDPRQRQLTSMV